MSSFKRRIPAGVSARSLAAAPGGGASVGSSGGGSGGVSSTTLDRAAPVAGRSDAPTAASGASLPQGVRNSVFSSPVPLVSTGIAALDDILSGGGQASGTVLLIVPSPPDCSPFDVARRGGGGTESDARGWTSAERYTDLILGYGAAQGLVCQHRSLLVGAGMQSWSESLMGLAGEDTEPPGERASEAKQLAESEDAEKIKIAWRYEKLGLFGTTVGGNVAWTSANASQTEQLPFCNTFDLSHRISPRALEKAKANESLSVIDPICDDDDETGLSCAYERAWQRIEKEAQRFVSSASNQAADSPSRVLRISVRALGSMEWTFRAPSLSPSAHATRAIRFLARLKSLARRLALAKGGASSAMTVVSVTLSPNLLLASPSSLEALAHLADGTISLSSFASSPELREVFKAYTGAIRVHRTPAIGTLLSVSLRASILRGMGSGAGSVSSDGTMAGGRSAQAMAQGGAGGAENNLAFKVKRKRLVIETLHLDVEGGVSERRTKPPRGVVEEIVSAKNGGRAEDPSASGQSQADPTVLKGQPHVEAMPAGQVPGTSHAHDGEVHTQPSPPPRLSGGLKSLRERGLAAAGQRARREVSLDGTSGSPGGAAQGRSSSLTVTGAAAKPPAIHGASAKDLEF